MFVQAHRGFSAAAPQNTGPAFVKAVEIGADGIECDVHFTADRKMVVIHNFTVDETSDGRGGKQADPCPAAGARFRRMDGGGIPRHAHPHIEGDAGAGAACASSTSSSKGDQSVYPGLPEQVCALAARMGLSDRLLISSFDHEMAVAAKKGRPGNPHRSALRLGDGTSRRVRQTSGGGRHPSPPRVLTREQVEACREAGVDVNPWTVDDPRPRPTLRDWGCTSVITNRPDVILAALS